MRRARKILTGHMALSVYLPSPTLKDVSSSWLVVLDHRQCWIGGSANSSAEPPQAYRQWSTGHAKTRCGRFWYEKLSVDVQRGIEGRDLLSPNPLSLLAIAEPIDHQHSKSVQNIVEKTDRQISERASTKHTVQQTRWL